MPKKKKITVGDKRILVISTATIVVADDRIKRLVLDRWIKCNRLQPARCNCLVKKWGAHQDWHSDLLQDDAHVRPR